MNTPRLSPAAFCSSSSNGNCIGGTSTRMNPDTDSPTFNSPVFSIERLYFQLSALGDRPTVRPKKPSAFPVFVTLKATVSVSPGRTYVVSFVISTVASWNSPAMTREVCVELYPLPAEVIDKVMMSTSESPAFCGTLTTTEMVVVWSPDRGVVEVPSSDVSAQPKGPLLTPMVKMSVVEPTFLMM